MISKEKQIENYSKKEKKEVKTKQNYNKKIIVSALFLIIVILAIIICFKLFTRNVVESPKSEMKKLPIGIKKQIENASPSATFHVPVLMYHYIENVKDKRDTIRQSLNITPYIFDKQIKTLQEAGYTFMMARDLGEVLDGKKQIPKNPILITIDDGHWDVDTDILPILKKYNAKATAYVIPGFTGGSDFMTKNQIQDVINSNLVEIGAHTVHHVSLKHNLSPIVTYEVSQSKKLLQDLYHIPVVSFAYPNGAFDEQAINIVKNAGFTTAVSTIPGTDVNQNDRFFIYRLRPGGRIGKSLLNYIERDDFRTKKKM